MKETFNKCSLLLDMAARIADALDEQGVLWAFGSSMVLKAHGLVDEPRDLDLFVALQDADKAHAVLLKFGSAKPREPKAPYETIKFCEFTLKDQISVDLISGFTVRHSEGSFRYEFAIKDQVELLEIEWETGKRLFPFTPLQDWYLLYQLMEGREKKVRAIEKHLGKLLDEGFYTEIPAQLKKLINQPVPVHVAERIEAFCKRHTTRTFRCDVAYDGNRYSGWQTQKTLPTVQQTLEKVMGKVLGHKVDIHGSGRTDAGVHARGQVFSFRTVMTMPLENFYTAVNRLLPKDIVIHQAKEVHPDFHARFDAQGKTYRYRIWNADERDVFEADYSWHVPQKLDEKAMQEAAVYMVGTKDFKSFMASGSAITDTVRTLYKVEIKRSGDILEMDFSGNGFLYNMVRIMTGLLVEVGLGKRQPDEVKAILASQDRTKAPLTAPPQGLYLMCVDYPNK